jgi:hypothetical protein
VTANETRLDNGMTWANDGQHHELTVRPRQKIAGELLKETVATADGTT